MQNDYYRKSLVANYFAHANYCYKRDIQVDMLCKYPSLT